MATLRVGILGTGGVAGLHAESYRDRDDAEIVAVYDRDEDRAISRSLDWGAANYHTDPDALLARDDIDAVEILTQTPTHHRLGIRALKSGKHVSIQRPLASTLEDANGLLKVAEESKGILHAFEPCLYYTPLLDARNLIDAGEIGSPSNLRISTRIAAATETAWDFEQEGDRWRFQADGDANTPLLTDIAYQAFCVSLFLVGNISRVQAWRNRANLGEGLTLDAPTTGMWQHHQQACQGTLSVSHMPERTIETAYPPIEHRIDIVGTRGELSVLRTPDQARQEPAVVLRRDGRTVSYESEGGTYARSYRRATDNFLAACRGDKAPMLRGTEAKQLLVLALAFNESARHGQSVSLKHG
jgi:predicted dehydrogenase